MKLSLWPDTVHCINVSSIYANINIKNQLENRMRTNEREKKITSKLVQRQLLIGRAWTLHKTVDHCRYIVFAVKTFLFDTISWQVAMQYTSKSPVFKSFILNLPDFDWQIETDTTYFAREFCVVLFLRKDPFSMRKKNNVLDMLFLGWFFVFTCFVFLTMLNQNFIFTGHLNLSQV